MSDPSNRVLDVVVAGGGPGGTATAFRARELGLEPLVLEFDDLMKRIRDYSKDKLILPSFGGGDRMAFPKGDECVSSLEFEPIDKDDLCHRWKGLYEQYGIERRIGAELTGLDREDDGVWTVRTWDHTLQEPVSYRSRHVVLAIGRGVPRQLDVPGNCEGVAFRLADAERYVGRPSCVIGGGTSAAEAVIAISNAKVAANDPTAVYWSYRGDKMPKVSRALADVFFQAYVGNGNIHYFRRSEPAAIVTGEDHQEYLAIRVDRRRLDGRPNETSHLEFLKTDCVACIGEDLPTGLLGKLGIRMRVGGKRQKQRMVTNRFLETEQPNVYFVGDILSQVYLETDDFGADPATFREVKHRGNIKSALRDGVRVAQVIRQRVDGVTDVSVAIEDARPSVGAGELIPAPSGTFAVIGNDTATLDEALSSDAPCLVLCSPTGVQGDELELVDRGSTVIGRDDGDLKVPDDPMIASRHAVVEWTGHAYTLRDVGNTSGVFLQIPTTDKQPIEAGDLVCLGRQFLRLAIFGGDTVFVHYDDRGQEVGRYPVTPGTVVLGRDAPVVLDADDRSLSRRHLAVTLDDTGRVWVKDLRSVNGSFLQVRDAVPLVHGSRFRLGHQLFALSLRRDEVLDTSQGPARSRIVTALQPEERAAESVAPGVPSVTFAGTGVTIALESGETVCDVAVGQPVGLVAECHAGICGSDPVRIVSGMEHVASGPGTGESETLEDICGLEPGPCRLACMLRVNGPVTVEVVKD